MSILLKRNDNPGIAPSPEELIPGEIALNTADSALYTKNQDGDIILLASAADLPPPAVISWSNITGKPSAFTPSTHTHSPSDIIGTAVITTDSRLSDNRDPNPHSHDWDGEDILNKPPINNDGERWYFYPTAQNGTVDIASYSDNYYVRVSEGGGGQTIGTKIKGPITLINGPTPSSIKFADDTIQTTAYTGLTAHTHPTSEITGLDSTIEDIQSDITNINTTTGNIESTISDINTNITNIDSDITNINTSIENIDSDISSINTNISSINSSISGINTDIGNLQTGKQDVGDYALSSHNHSYPNSLTKIGYNSALNLPILSNPDGISSIGITSVGYESCLNNTTGYQNSALGYRSLSLNTSGFFNSAFGSLALENSTTGYFNSAFGGASLRNNTTGTANIGIGTGALYYNTTGTANIALGHNALPTNTVGSYNIIIGTSADVASSNIDRSIVIGTDAVAQRTGDLVIASTTHPVVVSTTVGAAGTAANLPTRPLGYLEVRLNGILVKIPYYQV